MDKISKKISGIGSKGIKSESGNFFATSKMPDNLWNNDSNFRNGKVPFTESIQNQISKLEEETENYKDILTNPFGQNLNLLG